MRRMQRGVAPTSGRSVRLRVWVALVLVLLAGTAAAGPKHWLRLSHFVGLPDFVGLPPAEFHSVFLDRCKGGGYATPVGSWRGAATAQSPLEILLPKGLPDGSYGVAVHVQAAPAPDAPGYFGMHDGMIDFVVVQQGRAYVESRPGLIGLLMGFGIAIGAPFLDLTILHVNDHPEFEGARITAVDGDKELLRHPKSCKGDLFLDTSAGRKLVEAPSATFDLLLPDGTRARYVAKNEL